MPYDAAIWRTYAKVYDTLLRIIPYRNLLLDVVERADIRRNLRLLDVASGTGNLLTAMSDSGATCNVTAIDLSKDMTALAHDKIAAYAGPVDLVHGDLSLPAHGWGLTGLFDRLVINNALWVMDDPTAVLRELTNVAANRAVLVVSTPRPDPNVNELIDDHLRASEDEGRDREQTLKELAPLLREVIKCNEVLFSRYGNPNHLPSEPALRDWFKQAGWRVDELTTAYSGQNWMVQASKI